MQKSLTLLFILFLFQSAAIFSQEVVDPYFYIDIPNQLDNLTPDELADMIEDMSDAEFFGFLGSMSGFASKHNNTNVRQNSNMIQIRGGTYLMGSSAGEVWRDNDEGPQHFVTIKSFSIGKYPVTQKEYREVMGTTPGFFKGDNLPVENVSWYDAVEYCNALSRKEGLTPAYAVDKSKSDPCNISGQDKVRWLVTWNRNANGYRLPTEAEWECVCRAGTKTPFSTGYRISTNNANYNGNYPYYRNARGIYRAKTTEVGSFAPNQWGFYDMNGNVWEWCWDWYGSYSCMAQNDPTGASSGFYRVLRGGGWGDSAQRLRSANRGYYAPSGRINGIGFRIARNAL